MLSRFHRIPERDGQTDRRTDRIAIRATETYSTEEVDNAACPRSPNITSVSCDHDVFKIGNHKSQGHSQDMFIRLDRIHDVTDGRMNRLTPHDGIASRGKNRLALLF